MKKLDLILLVDDEIHDNFFHERVIKEAQAASRVESVKNGEEALGWLTTTVDGKYPRPELIFLDINMPRMSGWEFLDAYRLLPSEQQGAVIIIMLTTSLNPEDEERAKSDPLVQGYYAKPLTEEILKEVIDKHFSS